MRASAIIDKVIAFTEENALLSVPCHVLVGVSGGADSMALLHMLTHWPTPNLQVSAIHIHHGLRGAEADSDAAFVAQYCASHLIPLITVHMDVGAIASTQHLSVEEAGRRARYAQFEEVRKRMAADYVVTAHTLTDHVETIMMHILRGCGIDGLTGIPHTRGVIRRPLLCCTRDEIEVYCDECSIAYVNDGTNQDVRFQRNAVRHRLIPVLKEFNPSANVALVRLANHAAADAAYLNELAAAALDEARCETAYRLCVFLRQPSVLVRRMIRLLISEAQVPLFEETHIQSAEQAIRNGRGGVSLPCGYRLVVQQERVSVIKAETLGIPASVGLDTIPLSVDFGSKKVEVSVSDWDEKIHKLLLKWSIDHDKIMGKLCLRCRQSGDYMHPSGRGVGKSLKKLMNEWRIPSYCRDTYPLLCDDNGVILVPGYACDERVRITDDTRRCLLCKLLDKQI